MPTFQVNTDIPPRLKAHAQNPFLRGIIAFLQAHVEHVVAAENTCLKRINCNLAVGFTAKLFTGAHRLMLFQTEPGSFGLRTDAPMQNHRQN